MRKISVITGLVLLTIFALLGSTALAQSDTPTIPSTPSGYDEMMDDTYGYMENGFGMMDFDFMGSFSNMMGDGFAWMRSDDADMMNGYDSGMWNNGFSGMGGNGFGMMGGHGSGMGDSWMNDDSRMGNDFNGMGGFGR